MRQKNLAVTAMAVAVLGGLQVMLAPVAGAQTGPPPGLCTITGGTQDAGSVLRGTTITIRLSPECGFSPGDPVTISVNGVSAFSKAADDQGGVTVTVTAQADGLLLVGDPVLVPGSCASNVVVGTGFSAAAAATVSQSARFTVVCPTATHTQFTGTSTGTAITSRGGLARTGANLLRLTAIALALAVSGGLIVTTTRRRRQAQAG